MRLSLTLCALVMAAALTVAFAEKPLDREAERWVEQTLQRLTPEQLVGQMLMLRFAGTYTSTDSDAFELAARLVREAHVGGVIGFGGEEAVPQVLLNPTYGPTILGQPLAMASTINRLQALANVPLLAAADFEWGAGMRLAGATRFPRAMAFGAGGDVSLAEQAGRLTGREGRALGVHINFAPVADVNNNPRNPVINIRSFGEDVAVVSAMTAAWTRGIQDGGMLATLKHFPGHGDTGVDSHLGLPLIEHPRERLEAVELPPFAAGIAAGAAAVMVAHAELPALDPARGPATLSRPIVTGVLREQLKFDGLIITDSMLMDGVARLGSAADNAVKAAVAGNDLVIDPPDVMAAFEGLKAAMASGTLPRSQVEASVRRILRAKAAMGLHKMRQVDLDTVPDRVGTRAHAALARTVSERAVTLLKDDRGTLPLRLPPEARVLYLSVLDYPRGWRIAAPSRTAIPALRARWPGLQAVEISDQTTADEMALVRALASGADAVIAGIFVRAASGTNRLDLAPSVVGVLQDVARSTSRAGQPFVAAFFGSPYAVMTVPEVPAALLTYDFSDEAEHAAVKAMTGEIAIRGRLPIALPGFYAVGHGLQREPVTAQ